MALFIIMRHKGEINLWGHQSQVKHNKLSQTCAASGFFHSIHNETFCSGVEIPRGKMMFSGK